jgi:hypothetical protein
VLPDDAVGDAESQARPLTLRRDEGVEDLRQDVGGNAGARVLDLDADAIRLRMLDGNSQAAGALLHLGHRLAVAKTLFLDIVKALTASGVAAIHIPAKLEGLAFGQDVTVGGVVKHTLYVSKSRKDLPKVGERLECTGQDEHGKPVKVTTALAVGGARKLVVAFDRNPMFVPAPPVMKVSDLPVSMQRQLGKH